VSTVAPAGAIPEVPAVPAGTPRTPGRRRAASLLVDLIALTKPRITVMVVLTTLGGAWLAARGQIAGPVRWQQLVLALIGTALIVAGANVLNMYLERDSDALMERTRSRPLQAGRMAPEVALVFGLALSAVSLPLLTFGVNPISGLLAAIALVSYVLAYTPLKRRTTAALLIGAVPGAIPPLLGWTAMAGAIERPGVLLFGIMFLWQVPHFLAIATFRRDDYARAGLKVLPVERGDRVTRRHIVGYLIALLIVSLLLAREGIGGPAYLVSAIVLGAAFLGVGIWGLRPSAGPRWARGLFFGSMIYLVLLLAALMVGA
jgi:protoheme IX farnesyltransferase